MSEPYLGQIQSFGFNFAPRSWTFCDGQILPIAQYTALFSLLGTTYGGDGRTTFGLPDLRGRRMTGVGNGPGLNPVNWGQRAGAVQHTLTSAQMPSHNHHIAVNEDAADKEDPTGNFLAATSEATYKAAGNGTLLNGQSAVSNTGNGQSFPIVNPYLGVYSSIALQGQYPSRS
jgi:microcystin-dependent protein